MSTWVICTFWTVELRKCRISTDHTRTTHLLCIMCHAEQVTNGFLIARWDYALCARGIQGTHVTRTRGESVARTQLEVHHVLNMLWRVYVLQTRTTYQSSNSPQWLLPLTVHYISNAWRNRCEEIDRSLHLSHGFASIQHALASTAGWDPGLCHNLYFYLLYNYLMTRHKPFCVWYSVHLPLLNC